MENWAIAPLWSDAFYPGDIAAIEISRDQPLQSGLEVKTMTTPSDVIRQSDLLHQLVLDRNTLEELGRVEVLWMYPPAHRVLGFICKSGFLGNQKAAFQLKQVDAIGANGLMVSARPDKTTADRVRQLESLIDYEVWSDEGNRVGKITDCLLNWRTGEITAYLLVSAGWASVIGEVYQLPPDQILSFGQRRVLVAEAAIAYFALYQPGISQKISQAGEHLKEEVAQEWASIAQRAEAKTEQAKEQLHQLTNQAKVRAEELSRQMKAKTQIWLEQAKEKSQILAEQVEEHLESLSQREEDPLESDPIDDWFDFDWDEDPPTAPDRSGASPRSARTSVQPNRDEPIPADARIEAQTEVPSEARPIVPPSINPFPPSNFPPSNNVEADVWDDFDFDTEVAQPSAPPNPIDIPSTQASPAPNDRPPIASSVSPTDDDDAWI